ncbi:putative fatty acid elongation protein 3 [Diplonema papillatum]|nr:putative fatty acid elongation protein 3 [Diplonema papillatum]
MIKTLESLLPEGSAAAYREYDCRPAMDAMRGNYELPAAAVAGYLLMVFLLPRVAPRPGARGKAAVKPCFFLWNMALSVFSFWGCAACLRFVIDEASHVAAGGDPLARVAAISQHLICSDEMIFRFPSGACFGPVGLAATLFTLSKFVELGDTFFIIILGKKVEFLQWWHHATVLAYCWLAFGERTPSALIFGSMNYFVHSVMYLYFAVSQYSSILRPFRLVISLLQLGQMVVGCVVVSLSYFYTRSSSHSCSSAYSTWYFWCCGVMYLSYFILFLQLILNTYIFGTRKAKPE